MNRPDLQPFQEFSLPFSELSGRVYLDNHFTMGSFLNETGEFLGPDRIGMMSGSDRGQFECRLGLNRHGDKKSKAKEQQ